MPSFSSLGISTVNNSGRIHGPNLIRVVEMLIHNIRGKTSIRVTRVFGTYPTNFRCSVTFHNS